MMKGVNDREALLRIASGRDRKAMAPAFVMMGLGWVSLLIALVTMFHIGSEIPAEQLTSRATGLLIRSLATGVGVLVVLLHSVLVGAMYLFNIRLRAMVTLLERETARSQQPRADS
jgi:hypothetical protein